MSLLDLDLDVISMRCLIAKPGDSFDWHTHPFDEFTLVTDDEALVGHSNKEQAMRPNTLCYYQRDERHGAWCLQRQSPKFWVIHFALGEELGLPIFHPPRDAGRTHITNLSFEQAETFKWLFLQLLNERVNDRKYCRFAQCWWLSLLLVSVQRWADGEVANCPLQSGIKPELVQLWDAINSSVASPEEFARRKRLIANYDSLRHSFARTFGVSPRELMSRLRMQQAKNLLLETTLSVKEVSQRMGYARQHEFARAFNQHFGFSPSAWRTDPFRKTYMEPPSEPIGGGGVPGKLAARPKK